MFSSKQSDFHLHLNGSFGIKFLKEVAERNNATESFNELLKVRQQYAELMESKMTPELTQKSIGLIWKQFALIHKIIQTLADIQEGTMDVVSISKAAYLEIRTTPKAIGKATWVDYADVFVKGLLESNKKFAGQKIARGMLSVDRTLHTFEEACAFVDYVAKEKTQTGMLVGIDISGNPVAQRKLTGDDLGKFLHYVIKANIGIAIHAGEVESAVEEKDVDVILSTLQAWKEEEGSNEPNFFSNKVRLGHCIFLTDEQRKNIKKLKIPVEICPACHTRLGWCKKDQPHPVTKIYTLPDDFVLPGTDDELIFGSDAEEEGRKVSSILGYPEDTKMEEVRERQSKCRFDHFSVLYRRETLTNAGATNVEEDKSNKTRLMS